MRLLGLLRFGWLLPSPGKFFTISSCFLMFIHFVFFFWNAYDLNAGAVNNIVPEVSDASLFSFYAFFFFHFSFHYFFLFSFFPVSSIYFHLLSSSSLSFLLPQLLYCWFPPKAFNLSYCIVHYWLIILYFFYVLFKNSFIFSICVSSLFTVRNTQRASQSYTDKGRQKKEWGNQEQKRESQKGSEWSSW